MGFSCFTDCSTSEGFRHSFKMCCNHTRKGPNSCGQQWLGKWLLTKKVCNAICPSTDLYVQKLGMPAIGKAPPS